MSLRFKIGGEEHEYACALIEGANSDGWRAKLIHRRVRRSTQPLGVMTYALVAIGIGVLAYLGTVASQSAQARSDLSAWGDRLVISAVITAFLGFVMFWGMFERLSATTLTSLVEGLFRRRPSSGLVDLRAFPGFVALPFTVLSALHVLVLLLLKRGGPSNDA